MHEHDIDLKPRLPADIYIDRRDNRVLILDTLQPSWMVTNDNSFNLLRLFDGHTTIKEVLSFLGNPQDFQYQSAHGLIKKALQLGIIWVGRRPNSRVRTKNLNSIHLTLSRKCNLRCIYCYADAGKPNNCELSAESWEKIISEIVDTCGPINFVITGGEPTLFNGMERLVSHIKSLNCTVQLITNGCWNNEVNIESLSQAFTQIIVSIDGSSPEINDAHRGAGTFNKAFNTVTRLKEYQAKVEVAVVVTKKNATDTYSIRALFEPMGVPVRFQPMYLLGRGAGIQDISINGGDYFAALMASNRDNKLSLFDRPLEIGIRSLSCGVGGGTLSIDSDGSVYPCHLLHEHVYSLES